MTPLTTTRPQSTPTTDRPPAKRVRSVGTAGEGAPADGDDAGNARGGGDSLRTALANARRMNEARTGSGPVAESRSHLGTVMLVAAVGIGIVGLADALGRSGHLTSAVLPLFFAGLLTIFVPCAWRLLGTGASRYERARVSLVLGVGLLVAYVLRSPLLLDGFDELLHGATLSQLMAGHSLLVSNTALPVSSYYPALELLTSAVKWITGLPVGLAQLFVLFAVRVVLVLAVFLVTERVGGSARAGGVGVLVYAANPQFYSFDAQYGYETLALGFAAAAVYLLISATRAASPTTGSAHPGGVASTGGIVTAAEKADARARRCRKGLDIGLALACLAALAVTHHLTSWLTVLFLLVVGAGLDRTGRLGAARVMRFAAISAFLLAGDWTILVGKRIWNYLDPIFHAALTGAATALGQLHTDRQLFHSAAGAGAAPKWEIVVMLAAAVGWCLLLVPAALSAILDHTVRGRSLRWIAVAVAAGFPLALLASVSSASSEVGARATTFIFFGMAVVVGAWFASSRFMRTRHRLWRVPVVAVASVCFLGMMIFGSGPDWSFVPGRYLVGADQRSVGAPSIAVAEWVATHVPTGTHVAADRVTGALLADLGHVEPVTAIGGLVNAGPLFFDPSIGHYETSLIRKAQVRYIVVDDRLASGLPKFGTYVEPGEAPTPKRLTLEELRKYDSVPGVRLVYDNGPIQVYDLSALLGAPAPMTGPLLPSSASATNVVVLLAAVGVSVLIGVRMRRRRRGAPFAEGSVLRWIAAGMVVGVGAGAIVVPLHVSRTTVGLAGLATVAGIGLVATRQRRSAAPAAAASGPPRSFAVVRRGHQWQLVFTGAALRTLAAAVFVSAGVALATVSALGEWRTPDQVTLAAGPAGQTVVTVQLATAAPGARLELSGRAGVVMSRPLAATTSAQTVVVPASISPNASNITVVTANGAWK